MKATKITLLGLALCIVMAIWIGTPKYYLKAESVNKTMVIQDRYTDVLIKPEGERVVGSLSLNDEVTLTGNYCEYRFGKKPDSLWAEVYYEDKTAWVAASKLRQK